jgi:uncharacterized protein YggE
MQKSAPSPLTLALILSAATVLAVALTLSVVGLTRAGTVSVLPVTSQQTGITVCGHGKSTARPDQAQIQVGVRASAATAEGARAQAAQAMNAVLAALKSNGVVADDIQTDYFAIQPEYAYSGGAPQLIGYAATNSVIATIRAVDNVGKVVDAVTQAGGNNVDVNGIQFSKGDPTQALAQAEQNALADAHSQAEEIAAGAGVGLGAPISIQVGSCGASALRSSNPGAAAGASSTTPFQPGQQQFAVDVEVVYAIR